MKAPKATTFRPGGRPVGGRELVTCDRCGEKATHGYEGSGEFLDFCDQCFEAFGEWLNSPN